MVIIIIIIIASALKLNGLFGQVGFNFELKGLEQSSEVHSTSHLHLSIPMHTPWFEQLFTPEHENVWQ